MGRRMGARVHADPTLRRELPKVRRFRGRLGRGLVPSPTRGGEGGRRFSRRRRRGRLVDDGDLSGTERLVHHGGTATRSEGRAGRRVRWRSCVVLSAEAGRFTAGRHSMRRRTRRCPQFRDGGASDLRTLRPVRDLRWAVAGLVVGTAMLSGCSEKVEANDTLPSTSAAETTAALPPAGPADFPVPDEARTKDAAGAEAFLHYWIDLVNHQRAVPDGEPLRDLGPSCATCLRIARSYDDTAAAGYRYVGGDFALEGVATELQGDAAVINFIARHDAVQRVDGSG